jgi:hypothetical protein
MYSGFDSIKAFVSKSILVFISHLILVHHRRINTSKTLIIKIQLNLFEKYLKIVILDHKTTLLRILSYNLHYWM